MKIGQQNETRDYKTLAMWGFTPSLPPDATEKMEADKKKFPQCQYSISSSSSTSFTNGKKKSENHTLVRRLCPNPKQNAVIYDDTGGSSTMADSLDNGSFGDNFADMAEKFFNEQQSAMERIMKERGVAGGARGGATDGFTNESAQPPRQKSAPAPFKPRYKGHTPSETVVSEPADV